MVTIGGQEEFGRELKASELVPKTVVLIGHDRCKAYASVWVDFVGDHLVAFVMGEIGTVFVAFRTPDDTLRDGSGKHIRVFEYLGEIADENHRRPL